MSTHDPTTHDSPAGDFGATRSLTMTEEEFIAWAGEDVRAEWVDGSAIMMSPASREHADLNGWLTNVLRPFVESNDLGKILGPEYAIRLAEQRRRRVPDVVYIAKECIDRMTTNHVEGAPDLAIEIVSPDSESRDWREKYHEYQTAGVREYWVIDPMSQHAEVYALDDKGQYHLIEPHDGKIASIALPGFWIKVEWLWPDTRPKVLDALREIGVL